jgi:hypothetical protein
MPKRRQPACKRRPRTEYRILDGSGEKFSLVYAGGRPVILKTQKTAEKFIAEMGMEHTWRVRQDDAFFPDTRGRKPDYNSEEWQTLRKAHVAWEMTKPEKRPMGYTEQRAFMERFRGPLTGDPKQKQKAVRAFFKAIRRFNQAAQPIRSLDSLLTS